MLQDQINLSMASQQPQSHSVRQNLINQPQQNHLNIQLQHMPILAQPPPPNGRHFVHYREFQQLITIAQMRRTMVPLVPISGYKFYVQMCMLVGCLIEIIFFTWTYIHVAWVVWYLVLGYQRHRLGNRRVRFLGEFVNLSIWIWTNCYIFSSSYHKPTVFPVILLLVNMDYYFIGFNLFFTYLCFISYIVWNCFADCRLKMIQNKLQKKKKNLIKNTLQKFIQNQQNQLQNSSIQNSIQTMNESIQQAEQKNTCPICLSLITKQVQTKSMKTARLQCSHRYHYSCIRTWMESDQWSCPICRAEIVP